jgi:Zn-dependent protease with chaperone function
VADRLTETQTPHATSPQTRQCTDPLDESRPWQVPSQVVGRFIIAVTAVVGATVFGYQALLLDMKATHARAVCVSELRGPAPVDVASGTVNADAAAAFQACVGTQQQDSLLRMLAGLAVFAVATLLVFLAAPWATLALRRLRRVDRTPGLEALARDLRDLVAQAGLARRPPVFVLSRSCRVSGATFGHHPVRFVRLDLGTVHASIADPALFRAVVLHELAHLRNRDVDITRLTVALGWAFPVAVLAPVTAGFLARMHPADLVGNAVRLALLSVLVTVSALSVLRAREYGADARLTGAEAGGMAALLGRDTARQRSLSRPGRCFRLHPLPQARIDRLVDPDGLLRARVSEALLAGLTVGVAAPPLMDFCTTAAHDRLLGMDPITAGAVLTGLLLGAPAALYLTAAVWRAAGGGQRPSGWRLGLGLGAGALAGRLMSWPTLYAGPHPQPFAEITLALLILLGITLTGHWAVQTARTQPASSGLRRRWWLAVTATTVVFTMLLAGWLSLQTYLTGTGADMFGLIAASVGFRDGGNGALRQIVLTGDVVLWWAGRIAEVAPYLSAALVAALLLPLRWAARQRRAALGTGVAVGLPAAGLLLFAMVGFAVANRDPAIGGRALATLFEVHTLLPITAVEVVAAVVAASGAVRLRSLSGLLAAVTSGLFASPAVIASLVVFPCIAGTGRSGCLLAPDLVLDARILRHALLVAPLLGLFAAAAVTLVAAVARRIPDRSRLQRLTRMGILAYLTALLVLGAAAVGVNRLRPVSDDAAPDRDPCLIGTWRRTSAHLRFPVKADSDLGALVSLEADSVADLTSDAATGYATAYRADGTATDFYDLAGFTGTVGGLPVRNIQRGMMTYRWLAHDRAYRQLDAIGSGYRQEFRYGERALVIAAPEPDSAGQYTCTADQLTITGADAGDGAEEVFTRVPG